jgi:hypothetical protein
MPTSGGVFTHVRNLGWQPREEQTQKQGGWWLQGLVHYDTSGEVLLIHRVTGEVHVDTGHAPTVSHSTALRMLPCVEYCSAILNTATLKHDAKAMLHLAHCMQDEIITPPLPHSWSMWYMGYAPSNSLQRSIDVHPLNMTYLLGVATPGQACPLAAWSAYWTLRTHGIPTERCVGMRATESSAGQEQGVKAFNQRVKAFNQPARSVLYSRLELHVLRAKSIPSLLCCIFIDITLLRRAASRRWTPSMGQPALR